MVKAEVQCVTERADVLFWTEPHKKSPTQLNNDFEEN